jgi:hypothetical protein
MAGIGLTGKIEPLNPSLDTYPVFEDTFGLGGYRSVSLIDDRNSIPELRRKWGCITTP